MSHACGLQDTALSPGVGGACGFLIQGNSPRTNFRTIGMGTHNFGVANEKSDRFLNLNLKIG